LGAQDGEEIIQEVFLALFQHLLRGKPRHNLRAWVFQVAYNLALKHHKVACRDRQTLQEYGSAATQEFFVDPSPSPEDQLIKNQPACSIARRFRSAS
jgi:RNA polymerase sigma-70 factor (ECF subfamily)